MSNSRIIAFEFVAEWVVVSVKCFFDEDDFFTTSWTRRCSASFATEYDSPGTLKSISCSSLRSTNWSSSTCSGVNTQPSPCILLFHIFLSDQYWEYSNFSEDHLSVSRIRSPYLLLEVHDHAEEECSVYLPLGKLARIELLVQYQSKIFHEQVQSLKTSKQ